MIITTYFLYSLYGLGWPDLLEAPLLESFQEPLQKLLLKPSRGAWHLLKPGKDPVSVPGVAPGKAPASVLPTTTHIKCEELTENAIN